MFDEYDNHVRKGSEVLLNMEGLHIQDQLGLMRKVIIFVHFCLQLGLIDNCKYGKVQLFKCSRSVFTLKILPFKYGGNLTINGKWRQN